MLPSLEILQSVRGRKDLSFPCMLRLVDDVREMEVGAREGGIKDVLRAFRAMAVYILDIAISNSSPETRTERTKLRHTLIAFKSPYDNEFGPIRTTGLFL
jgi:hypothetical protein